MADILDIYEMPYNPEVPVVCMDEKPYQLLGETREPLPMRPGDKQKTDSEYVRKGLCWSYVKKKYKLNATNFPFLCNC